MRSLKFLLRRFIFSALQTLQDTAVGPYWHYMYTFRAFLTYCISISDLGDGWAPAILETEQEFNFLREAMGTFISTARQDTFIGGSTCIEPRLLSIEYSDYNTYDDDDGKSVCEVCLGFQSQGGPVTCTCM